MEPLITGAKSKNGQGGMPLFVLEITPGFQMIS